MKLITSADTKPQLEQPVSSVLPEICLHQVYKEAALCLLCAGQYTDCVLVCDKFLQAMGIGNSDSFCTGLQSARQSMPENLEEDEEDFFGLLTDENVVLELKEMRQTQQISGCGKEYKRYDVVFIILCVLYLPCIRGIYEVGYIFFVYNGTT